MRAASARSGTSTARTRPGRAARQPRRQAAAKKTVIDLLARTGTEIQVTQAAQGLRYGIAELLALAQHAGTVRAGIQITEIMALLTSTCQGALQAGWNSDLQHRTLTVIFDGLRPQATP